MKIRFWRDMIQHLRIGKRLSEPILTETGTIGAVQLARIELGAEDFQALRVETGRLVILASDFELIFFLC